MLLFQPDHLARMQRAAEADYPNECCGLIVGQIDEGGTDRIVTRIVPSPNVSTSNLRDSFEVDPKVRFDLMRELEGGDDDIIGHYHSHPDHAAEPSETDRSMVYEPDLLWVIMSVEQSRVVDPQAFRVLTAPITFSPVEIRSPSLDHSS